MTSTARLAALTLAAAAASLAHAAPVNLFVGTTAAGNQTVTFDSVAGGAVPGTNYNGVLTIGSASFAERFAGLSLGSSGNFDTLSGTPTGPLTLQAGAPNANLAVVEFGAPGNQVLAGIGPGLFPSLTAIGPGAISALFSVDQSELGFDLLGTDLGAASVRFFRRDGTLIDTVLMSNLANTSYTFRREGGLLDIAGFAMTTTDAGGVGMDNVRYNLGSTPPPIGTPEPGSLALVGLALVGAYAARRRVGR